MKTMNCNEKCKLDTWSKRTQSKPTCTELVEVSNPTNERRLSAIALATAEVTSDGSRVTSDERRFVPSRPYMAEGPLVSSPSRRHFGKAPESVSGFEGLQLRYYSVCGKIVSRIAYCVVRFFFPRYTHHASRTTNLYTAGSFVLPETRKICLRCASHSNFCATASRLLYRIF